MLIDLLSATLQKSKALDAAWGKMDAGEDAVIGVASSARPFWWQHVLWRILVLL